MRVGCACAVPALSCSPEYMAQNCPLSCQLCEGTSTTCTTPDCDVSTTCEDAESDCEAWAEAGYCEDEEWWVPALHLPDRFVFGGRQPAA